MKTQQFEQKIKHAKLAHRNNCLQTCYKNGILIRHVYPDQQQSPLSWWDDFGFIINDYRVSVAWCHPRQAFRDFIEAEAIDMVLKNDLELARCHANIETIQKPIYKKLGRSRKKVKGFEYNVLPNDDYVVRLKKVKRDIEASTEFTVLPSFNIRWTNKSRIVFACIPMEIHNEDDVILLASVIKRLIKREVSLQDLFSGYRYTRCDWETENEHRGLNEFHVHRIS